MLRRALSSRRLLAGSALLLAGGALLLAGCGRGDNDARRAVVIGSARGAPATDLIRAATRQGLVTRDAQGRIVPGLADRWIVTDGGLAYIFRVRGGIWADGGAVSGESVAAALREAIEDAASTPLGPELSAIGTVQAMAGRVVEIRLTRAMPDFLDVLAQSELGLARHGRGWGPMDMKRYDGDELLSPVSPERRGLSPDDPAAADLARLRLATLPAQRAIAAYRDGSADVVLDGDFTNLPLVAQTTLGPSRPRFDPVSGLFGLVVTRADGILASPDGRGALAMAIDRGALASGFSAAGWAGTTRIVSPGTDGDPGLVGERWAEYDLAGRRTLASERIAQLTAGSHVAPSLTIAMPQGPGADFLFGQLAEDFAAVGVTLRRARAGEAAQLRVIDSVAAYPRAAWFLDQLSCRALHGLCSAAADTDAARARQLATPASTNLASGAPAGTSGDPVATQWAVAEQTLTASNIYIPLGPPIRWSLARSNDPGFAINRWGFHPLTALASRPR